jgi:hypothetical protein
MKANVKQIIKYHIYFEKFKRETVTIYESAKCSVLQVEKRYGSSNVTIYN